MSLPKWAVPWPISVSPVPPDSSARRQCRLRTGPFRRAEQCYIRESVGEGLFMIQSKLPWMCSGLALLVALTSSAEPKTWKLIWSDEFDGPAKSAPDPKKWGFSIGGGGWGNRELQTYTSRRENSFLDGKGNLVIEARRERFTGPDGITRDYTSARLNT